MRPVENNKGQRPKLPPSSGVMGLDSASGIAIESLGLVAFQGIQYIRKATFRDEIDGLAG